METIQIKRMKQSNWLVKQRKMDLTIQLVVNSAHVDQSNNRTHIRLHKLPFFKNTKDIVA